MLADWAAIAIENARLYRDAAPAATSSSGPSQGWRPRRRSRAPSARETDLERVLELVVKRGRALVEARTVVHPAARGRASSWSPPAPASSTRARSAPRCRWTARSRATCCARAEPERIDDLAPRCGITTSGWASRRRDRAAGALDLPRARPRRAGAFDRVDGELTFGDRDEQLLHAFAASAATAVATAKSVEAERLRHSLALGRAGAPPVGARAARRDAAGARRARRPALCRRCAPAREALEQAARGDRAARRRDREPARADHRAAPGGAGRARARGRARGLARRVARGRGPRDRAESSSSRRGRARARAGDRRLPPRPGGAHQRRSSTRAPTRSSARAQDAGRGRGPRRRRRLRLRPRRSRPRASACRDARAGRARWRRARASRGRLRRGPSVTRRLPRSDRGSVARSKPVVERVADELGAACTAAASAGCAPGGTRRCARSGRAARRSRRSCGRARSGAGSPPRARSGRRAGPGSGGAAARRAPSPGLR